MVTMFGAPPRTFRRMVCVSTVVFRQIQRVSRIVFYDFDDLRVCNVAKNAANSLTIETTVKVTPDCHLFSANGSFLIAACCSYSY
jgi:hypothetical protein